MGELWRKYMYYTLLILGFKSLEVECMDQVVQPSCNETVEECEFFWNLDYLWTMNLYDFENRQMQPVVYNDGSFFINSCDTLTPLDNATLEQVVTADGRYKLIYAINNEFPGPNIVVYQGQTIVVHLTNDLVNEGITIHWHGIHQIGTPWMDGVSMVSQYPISPGETFTYRFTAHTIGTFWYHGHHGTMRTEGVSGPLIVLPRQNRTDIEPHVDDFLAVLSDWYTDLLPLHRYLLQRYDASRYQTGFDSTCFGSSVRALDGGTAIIQTFESALINGKGRSFQQLDQPTIEGIPLETFRVQWNSYYRFRVINTASNYAFRFSIDNHPLTVISADGFDVVPFNVESVILYPAERYDVMVLTDQMPSSYWIRSVTIAEKDTTNDTNTIVSPDYTLGVLQYTGVPEVTPATERVACVNPLNPCVILGCHYAQEVNTILGLDRRCHNVHEMMSTPESLLEKPVPIASEGDEVYDYFLNFHFQETDQISGSINGRQFMSPPEPFQLYGADMSKVTLCEDQDCERECRCTHMIEIPHNQIVQFIVTSQGNTRNGVSHPFHIHGVDFHVLKIGYPVYDNETGNILGPNPDVLPNEFFTSVSWTNDTWSGDNIPDLNLVDPPRKDSIAIPVLGYVVIRFRADNPGYWFVHCHVQAHHMIGMAMIVKIGEESEMPALPANFSSQSLRFSDIVAAEENRLSNYAFAITICCAVLLMVIIIQAAFLIKDRCSRCTKPKYTYVPNAYHEDIPNKYQNDEKTSLISNPKP